MLPDIDLVISFRISAGRNVSKQRAVDQAVKAERQYAKLLETLSTAGLRSAGRRGHSQDNILILVSCPQPLIDRLMRCERHSDFLGGIPTVSSPIASYDFKYGGQSLSPADRLRIIHDFVTHPNGGLGIYPGSPEWDLVDFVTGIHNHQFNQEWIRSWSTQRVTSGQIDRIRVQLGDAVAFYFHFLSAYTTALVFPAFLGVVFYFFGSPYSPVYSTLLVLWSIVFVECWRIRERIIATRNGTSGHRRVEKRRAQHMEESWWWLREVKMATSLPVILLFVTILSVILTAIFILEAFVAHLYTGPGHKFVSFSPTILFVLFVPRILALHHASAVRFTDWENHPHPSTHSSSLTLKVFTLSAIVSYLGLALSAFVYVPFGEALMQVLQVGLFEGPSALIDKSKILKAFDDKQGGSSNKLMDWNVLSFSRLQDQMFAYTVTDQAVNAFEEIGLPFIWRAIDRFWNRSSHSTSPIRKHFISEDDTKTDTCGDSEKETELLDRIRKELSLPDYGTFEDYSEMVTQFGYVVLWSTIWPLAPVMALINNILESRSDAIKIVVHHRRPIPVRTETIGPWLDAMSFLTWLAAITNSALVYLYKPRHGSSFQMGSSPSDNLSAYSLSDRWQMLVIALFIASAASHGYIVVRGLVQHVIEQAIWTRSAEATEMEVNEKAMKEKFLESLGEGKGWADMDDQNSENGREAFWERDEGLGEIQRLLKDA